MSSTYFISDLHLDAARPHVSAALATFLLEHGDCDQLFILGDLFEVWIGDDDDSPLAAATAALLRDFSAAGPRVYIMPGNRDFLLGNAYCRAVGATLLPDPTVIELYGSRTLLMHGDSLCTEDSDYQAFRRMTRDASWQAELLQHSLAERRALATHLRGMSREANSNKAEDIMDVTPSEVARVMRQHRVERLIHGHTHRPARHDEPAGTRWVLGDWDTKGWTLEVTPDDANLVYFSI